MVGLAEVDKLVDDHIIHDFQRCLDEPPAEVEPSPMVARPPALPGIRDADRCRRVTAHHREPHAPRMDLFCCFCHIPALYPPGDIGLDRAGYPEPVGALDSCPRIVTYQ